ncbi:hypothetical protein CI109_100961 [Kwoniella shandongensis]|uniref:Glycosyltransferase family 18 catalytic domain-containing protein n=1 Tax=Kwoniella shandongensis TaxID=1734106 RepID=A0A5M6C4J0_9TREE|nr:uncharacterized protein CI109_001429 [Kwoniella shandongensis]KAA5530026.1 hypothetical protein CI109_001429 [Kwoniella shandongensis]
MSLIVLPRLRHIALYITFVTTFLTLIAFLYIAQSPLPEDEDSVGNVGALHRLMNFKTPDFSSWIGTKVDRTEEANKIRELRETFMKRFPVSEQDVTSGRAKNGPVLQRLADCIEANTCGEGEETVVLLASFHFNNAINGHTSGEDIWALSSIEAFTALNYTMLWTISPMDTLTLYQGLSDKVAVVIWEGGEMKKCIDRNAENWQSLEAGHTPGTFQEEDGKFGCIKREGFEEGIPLHKSFAFHFWTGPAHPLGRQFTLSPEDAAEWADDGEGNHYLGYSIETRCRAVSLPSERQHRGLLLGKRKDYFDPENRDFVWPNLLGPAMDAMPSEHNETTGEDTPFELIATGGEMHDGKPEVLFDEKIHNLGKQEQQDWYQIVAGSKFLLGIGKPYLSPSPYDALCFGVPFINPIMGWDKENPHDWTKWISQHNALRAIEPPFVYHVQKGNGTQLEAAFKAALENPIDRFIPPKMRKSSVKERHRALVETDWMPWAEAAVEHLYTDKGNEFWGMNSL